MNNSFFFKLKLLSVCFCFVSITIYSQNFDTQLNLQDSTQIHVIFLKNGKKIKGRILEIQNEKVFFEKKKKKESITLSLSEIQEIKVVGNLSWNQKKYATPFQNNHFLFYKNTGFSLKQGERSYRTFMGASMLWDRGITDGFSIGLAYSFPLFLHANVKFSTPNSDEGASSFKSTLSAIPLPIDGGVFYILENSITHSFGTPDRFFNISATNFFIPRERNFFFDYLPKVYYSISLGGGIRMNENWQFVIENHTNFNSKFFVARLLPSFGFNYAASKFNLGFGFYSPNSLGFNLYPIIEINEDSPVVFSPQTLSRLPFFTFSKTF